MIRVENPSGELRKTADRDRKDIVLRRILAYALDGKRQGPTVYARRIVDSSPLPNPLTARTRLHYNQYEKHNHVRPRAEGAYLADRFDGLAGSDWKQVRKQKAAEALRQLDALVQHRNS